jgi:hypothetical protein
LLVKCILILYRHVVAVREEFHVQLLLPSPVESVSSASVVTVTPPLGKLDETLHTIITITSRLDDASSDSPAKQ